MKKKTKIILACIFLGIIMIGGGVWYHVQKVAQEKQELIQKSTKEIDEFYKWNYIGVEKTTTGKLWRNPASGELELDYTVYLKNGAKTELDAEWDKQKKILLAPYSKNVKDKPQAKIKETEEYDDKADNFLLQPKDIRLLKKQGYDKNISANEIRVYLEKMYPERYGTLKGE
ncbi:hypothetical protein LFYK43_16280 [Ligilactobacillus salitolerans]|uniref:Uncharacterized protein n=1 Tax=Ligilactobacillus salitolerans TaxID=1808352 RepID=A0A401IUG7_9LACO|nr:hypothetical protein [Ligilactobacillus salitolerans]GBG95169.1 hypothetical protein LFYK43_16280 [Ligilactobacillus salitolerans]